jgi:glycosyltransferase involved in cell wall biosynthesis
VLAEIAELRRRVEAILVIPAHPESALFHGELARQVSQYAIRLPVVSPMIVGYAVATFLRSPGRVARALVEVIKGSSRLSVLVRNLAVFPKAVYVARLIQQFGAHHIHAHWAAVPATMALVVSRLTGVPWSFTAHRWDIAENNLLKTKVRAARFARVISLDGRNEILDIIGVQTCPTLFTIHMGTALPEDMAIPCVKYARQFSIGCIANLVEKKGHRYLIEACRLLRERGCRFVCHVVGEGPLRGDLETLVREYGLREWVNFLGPLPHAEVMRMLREREIDLVALPSIKTATGEYEGIPVVLMEAMAHRVAVISTATGGIAELLGDGCGILVKPADARELADAIEQLIVDPAYRARLAEAGFARVSADFNLTTIVDRLVSLMGSRED